MKRDRSAENREYYIKRVRARLGAHVIITHRPKPQPKPPRERRRRCYPISAKTWRRALVLMLLTAGMNKTRDISAALNTDPTSVAQSICELKRLGALPSQIGRTPIRQQT